MVGLLGRTNVGAAARKRAQLSGNGCVDGFTMSNDEQNCLTRLSRKCVGRWVCLALLSLAAGGCEGRDAHERGAQAANCEPGAEPREEPGVLRGRVLAPAARLAQGSPQGQQLTTSADASRSWVMRWLIRPVHAAQLEGELPVPEAIVELFAVGPAGERTGEVLAQTTTNAIGQWCLRLPQGVQAGTQMMLQARMGAVGADTTGAGKVRLRRSLAAEFSTDIYSGSEALTQFLQEHRVDFTKIPQATYLNMESIADTRMDLLSPVRLQPGVATQQAVGEILSALRGDERLAQKLEALAKIE